MLILIVDDHPLYRDALSRLLPQIFSDLTVTAVGDCAAAFAHLRQFPHQDLVLLDLGIPDLDGRIALVRLRALQLGQSNWH